MQRAYIAFIWRGHIYIYIHIYCVYIYIWGTFLPAIFQSWDRVTTDTAKGCCERLRRHHQRQASPHCCTAGPLQFCQMCQGNPGKPMESTQKPWSFSTRNELGPTWPNYGGSFIIERTWRMNSYRMTWRIPARVGELFGLSIELADSRKENGCPSCFASD